MKINFQDLLTDIFSCPFFFDVVFSICDYVFVFFSCVIHARVGLDILGGGLGGISGSNHIMSFI